MDIKKSFDLSIKQQFLSGECILPGIFVSGEENFGRDITTRGKTKYHETYFNQDFGNMIKKSLSQPIYQSYDNGKGGELRDKFFCVGSSSRFAVACFTTNEKGNISYIDQFRGSKIKEIQFEKALRITGISGTPPQMDVYYKTELENFVEVKCHEIFDESEHTKLEIALQYTNNEIFLNIADHYEISIAKKIVKHKNGSQYIIFDRNDFGVKSKSTHFDLKQFLCHLMGIISYSKVSEEKNFIYLFYKSKDERFSYVYLELAEEIEQIKESFSWLFEKYHINFSVLYNESFNTLK